MESGAEPIKVLSSATETGNKNLLTVKYHRAQKASPEFFTVHEGIDQNVDIQISTIIFRAAPEPVITLYDFIMSTFVPEPSTNAIAEREEQDASNIAEVSTQQALEAQSGKIRVLVQLAAVEGVLYGAFGRNH